MLDLTGLTPFGNMVSGGGLAAVLDSNPGTTGYAQATTGYCGVDLVTPKRIGYVEIVSATNGYDASGLTSQITLKLYGKNTSAPANATDGTLIGTLGPFMDTNAQLIKTIMSTDLVTEYRYVWAVITTGVWAVAATLRVFEAGEIVEPVASSAVRFKVVRRCDELTPLTFVGTPIPAFQAFVRLNGPAELAVSFQANVVHRGEFTGVNGTVGYGFAVLYRTATTFAELASAAWETICSSGGNICERNPHHYGAAAIVGDVSFLQAGGCFIEFAVTGSAHSDLSVGTNGLAAILAEGGRGLNGFRLLFDTEMDVISG